jgi:hypothetical protein
MEERIDHGRPRHADPTWPCCCDQDGVEARLDALDFDIYTVANLAPITGLGREQLACFFRGLTD